MTADACAPECPVLTLGCPERRETPEQAVLAVGGLVYPRAGAVNVGRPVYIHVRVERQFQGLENAVGAYLPAYRHLQGIVDPSRVEQVGYQDAILPGALHEGREVHKADSIVLFAGIPV